MLPGDIIYASDFDRPYVRLTQQAVQSIGTSDTALTFGTGSTTSDIYGLHDEVVNNTRITVNKSGLWLVKGNVFIAANAAVTSLSATIGVNGTLVPSRSRSKPAAVSLSASQEVVEPLELASGDFIELYGVCSASATNSSVGGTFASTFNAHFLGPLT